jgi:hypothetical protein
VLRKVEAVLDAMRPLDDMQHKVHELVNATKRIEAAAARAVVDAQRRVELERLPQQR